MPPQRCCGAQRPGSLAPALGGPACSPGVGRRRVAGAATTRVGREEKGLARAPFVKRHEAGAAAARPFLTDRHTEEGEEHIQETEQLPAPLRPLRYFQRPRTLVCSLPPPQPPLLPAASPPHIPRAVRGRACRPACFPGERRPGVGWGATGLAGAPPVEGHEVEKDAIPVTRSTRPSAPTAPPGLPEVPAPSTALPSPGPHPPQGQAPVVAMQTWERRCRPTSLPVQRRHRWRHRAASRRRCPPS